MKNIDTTLVKKARHISYRWAVLALSSTLAACGGGGAQESSAVDDGVSNANPLPAAVSSTAELVAPDSFTFLESEALSITVDGTQEVYLSVCEANAEGRSLSSSINYDNCLLRTWVHKNVYEADINVAGHIDYLLAAVLNPSVSDTPLIYEWQRDDGLEWRIPN